MRRLFLLGLLTSSLASLAQTTSNAYRSSSNPLYWQNRKPDGAYWQQDVKYNINARLDETTNVIDAIENLEYWNNSPDTLYFVYFHLYQNAFIKGSHVRQLESANKVKAKLGKYEAAGQGIIISDLKADGQTVATELDNTILKVYLPKPLHPGSKTTFSMGFKTYYDRGSTRRRMQMYPAWGFMHYNGCQWFPKISVYDRKSGWDVQQHLGKEFYGDFGTFDVSLDFASNYVVEATGALQNREEVLPKELRDKLDMKNFSKKPWNEKPSIITPYVKGERKVWKYHADNVHDFAFTADPSYRISTSYWNGIECVGIAPEPHAAGWQNSSEYVARIIKTFSEGIGQYQYPKMVAADAQDGMEYPMLTLDGGSDPGYRGLLVHEIGHNWFYGMVGSNETYRAALDEGFTQFLTSWGLQRLEGKEMPAPHYKSRYRNRFSEPVNVMDRNVMLPYHLDALNKDEVQLNTHSDDFNGALGHGGGYRLVYYKTASMLYNLQYTLGDSLFQKAMQHYFHQWRFAHPYFEDFRNSIINYTHADLNWFFDQWLETTKTIDYSIAGIKKTSGQDSFLVKFRRKGEMQMPIDFLVTAKNGTKQAYNIPNTWFTKESDATVLPKWLGWGKLHETYEAKIAVPSGIKNVEIDTTRRLVDVYALDNNRRKGLGLSDALKLKWDGGIPAPLDRTHYRLYVRPDIWWNPVDGIKAGVHFEGDYMRTLRKLDATIWWNTHLLQTDEYLSTESEGYYEKYLPVSYTFNYTSPLTRNTPKLQLDLHSRFLDGLQRHSAGMNWLANGDNTVSVNFLTFWRPVSYDLDYLIYPNEWNSRRARPNSSINLSWTHRAHYRNGVGNYILSARAPFFSGGGANAFNYAYGQLEATNYNTIKKLEVRTRLFARYGVGSNIPSESALWLAGANPEELMENKYTRSVGFVPDSWQGVSRYETNHFQQGGGLNLRGYAGYFVADERSGEILVGYKGRSGVSGNVEVDFDNYIPLKPKFTREWLHADIYAFADAGFMELSRYTDINQYWNTTPTTQWSDLRLDAGLGIAATIKKWGPFDKAQPLTIRFDVPLFLNRPPFANPQYTTFRYVVGISRTF